MDKDIAEILDAIVWGHRIISIEKGQFVFSPLSLQDRNIANFLYEDAMEYAKSTGRKTREELKIESLKKGIWKANFDNDLKVLREELSSSLSDESKLIDQSKGKRNLPSALINLRKRIDFIKNTLTEIDHAYASCIELPSVEYYAEEQRAHYIIACSTLRFPSMKKVWDSHDAFLNEQDTELVRQLVNYYYKNNINDETMIRKIARSPIWRIKWTGSKKNGGAKTLFGRDMYDLTLDQFRLIYWSQIYDSAFESMEPPTDDVVDDDKSFDSWLEEQSEKRKQRNNKSSLDKKLNTSKDGQEVGVNVTGFFSEECNCGVKQMKNAKLHRHANSCPYGVFFYYTNDHDKKKKEIETIQSANPEQVRRILAKEQAILASNKDGVAEQDLRRDDSTRAILGMSTKLIGGREGPKGRAK